MECDDGSKRLTIEKRSLGFFIISAGFETFTRPHGWEDFLGKEETEETRDLDFGYVNLLPHGT